MKHLDYTKELLNKYEKKVSEMRFENKKWQQDSLSSLK